MNSLSFKENDISLEQALDQNSQLVRRCKQGDRDAQFEIYKKYNRAMFNICFRMLGRREDAEDVLQESFVLAFTKIDQYREDSTFGAWLKRLVINQCINELRKRKIQWVSETKIPEQLLQSEEQDSNSRYSLDQINTAIKALPEGYRLVFNLYLLEGYDHGEIAQILSINESTSKSQYLRAKRKMKELLSDIENKHK